MDWEQWMNGLDANYTQRKIGTRDTLNRAHPGPRFDDRHRKALKIQELITGRDFVAEFKRDMQATESDTAQLIYRTMLIGLGGFTMDGADAATRFLSGTEVQKQSATREIVDALNSAADAPAALSDSLQDALLGTLLDGVQFTVQDPGSRPSISRITPRAGDSIYIHIPRATPALRAKWASRGTVVGEPGWRAPSDRTPVSVYTITAVQSTGSFASITWEYTYRTPGAAPAPSRGAFATGGTIYLIRGSDGKWRTVSARFFIT
jgi:hypothetical protein